LEDPDRLMRVIRPMLKTENTKNDEKYESLMAKIRETYHGKKLEKVLKDIEAIRYFHVIREESQYMWETAYYYTRRTLERASEVMLGKAEIESDLVYLRLSELREACARGELNDSDREKIARRKEKRPLALEVWERSKAQVFESKSRGDTLKGVSGSPGEAAGPARVIRGPEEFDKDAAGRCAGVSLHRSGMDAAVPAGGRGRGGQRSRLEPRGDRGAGIRDSVRAGRGTRNGGIQG